MKFPTFFQKRWKIVLFILVAIYFLALFGLWISVLIPFGGDLLFLAGLMIWYLPGVLFSWTGFFEFHEFGASPTVWQGYVVMFLFYFGFAVLVSLPFGRNRNGRKS